MPAEFLILGPSEIRLDGRSLAIAGGRRRALLAALVLRAGAPAAADWLSEALWGQRAANALQATVSRARRDLGPLAGRLRTEGGGYRLHVEPGELDADRFASAYEEGRALLAAGRPDEASNALNQALGLWRGPVLGELGYEAFAQADVRRLEELRVLALEERVEADLARHEHAPLASELEALVAEHPLRERLRGQQMLALSTGSAGRRTRSPPTATSARASARTARRWPSPLPCGCSRAVPPRAATHSPTTTGPRSRTCAAASAGTRWRSSSPPPASACSIPPDSPLG